MTDAASPRSGSSLAREVGAASSATAGAGSALVATAATACCATPALASMTVALLGASGAAWAAGLQRYAPWLLAFGALALGFGFWSFRRLPASCCPTHAARRRRLAVQVVLALATALWLGSVVLQLRFAA